MLYWGSDIVYTIANIMDSPFRRLSELFLLEFYGPKDHQISLSAKEVKAFASDMKCLKFH